MRKPVLIVVTPGFPKDEQDTSCLPAFQQFALSIKDTFPQYRLMIVSFQYPFTPKEYQWNGIDVIALGGKNRSKLFRLVLWIRAYRALQKIIKTHHVIGLVSLWITECALIADKIAKKNRLKHMIWIIGQDAKISNKYVSRIKPKPQQLMAMSDFLKDEFFKNHNLMPLHVIENGIRESVFPVLNTQERPITVFGAGSLIPLKNYRLFIELIHEIKKSIPAIKAQIAGGGEEQEVLQTLITTLGLQENVILLGPKSHSETLALMNQSKVFLHTSSYEGNSTVLMEALYSGCKVISTCPLSHTPTQNLIIETDPVKLKEQLLHALAENESTANRVVFNTMDRSAQRIVNLLLQE
ncbi:MAG: glycosyltransferase [Bacteroidota bacterium]